MAIEFPKSSFLAPRSAGPTYSTNWPSMCGRIFFSKYSRNAGWMSPAIFSGIPVRCATSMTVDENRPLCQCRRCQALSCANTLPALVKERHLALDEIAVPTKAGSVIISGLELSPTHAPLRSTTRSGGSGWLRKVCVRRLFAYKRTAISEAELIANPAQTTNSHSIGYRYFDDH